MDNVVRLIKEKNQLLKHFLKMTTEECQRINAGDFSKLQVFYETREGFLKLIMLLDSKVKSANFDSNATNEKLARAAMNDLFKEKEVLIATILDKDLEMLSMVEKEKSEVIRDLQDVSRGRRVMSAYRNTTKAS